MNPFLEFAAGSVVGKNHLQLGRNNQDAYFLYRGQNVSIAVVADGCGSSPHSEFGAQLGVRLSMQTLLASYPLLDNHHPPPPEWWSLVTGRIVASLQVTIRNLSVDESLMELVRDYLLFTLVGVVVDAEYTTFFAAGDGVVLVNDEVHKLEAAGNAPAYIGYLALPSPPPMSLGLRPIVSLPTNELQRFAVATDGAADLLETTSKFLPGKDEPLMSLMQLCEFGPFFANPDRLRRYLALANREVKRLDSQTGQLNTYHGHLVDDTTIVLGRTRKEN